MFALGQRKEAKTAMHACKRLVIILSMLLFAGSAYAQFTASQIANKYSSSVITILTLDENDKPLSFGSGFFINTEGDIVTNHHVLEGGSKAIIKTKKGEEGYVLEIIKDDPELDLLIARTSIKGTAPVPLGNSKTITLGEDIVVIGNPVGLEGTISKGIISGIRESEGRKLIQITAPISQGSSGGPVFNLYGKVIGIATAQLRIGQNLNFAMPSNYLNSIKSVRIKLSSLPRAERKEDRWKLYYESKREPEKERWKLYYDKESIIKKGNFVHVWTRQIPVDKEGYRSAHMRWQKENYPNSVDDLSDYEYSQSLKLIDCVERKTDSLKSTTYGSNDNVILTRSSTTLFWRDILPHSHDEELYKAVCK